MSAPRRDPVLACVTPGRDVRLSLTNEQRRELGPHAQVITRVIAGAVRARYIATGGNPPQSFPMVDHFFAAVSRALDQRVGVTRSRELIRLAREAGVLRD